MILILHYRINVTLFVVYNIEANPTNPWFVLILFRLEAWGVRRRRVQTWITAPSDFPFLDSQSLLTETRPPPPQWKTSSSHTLASATKKKQLPNPNRWSPFVVIPISSSPYYTRAPTYYAHSRHTSFILSLSYITKPNPKKTHNATSCTPPTPE